MNKADWSGISALFLLSAGLTQAAVFNGVSIKVGDELQPAGGMVQMKLYITEPKPISSGGTKMYLDESFESVEGIALNGPNQDVFGAAVIGAGDLKFSYVSPSGTFGMVPDYPVLTVAARIRKTAPLGSKTVLSIDPAALNLKDPFGMPYPTEFAPGSLTIADGVSIANVTPGSAFVPAGGTVIIDGLNFTPRTDIKINETKVTGIRFINSTRLEVTIRQGVVMHARRVRAINPDGTSCTYFSYQRTKPAPPSSNALLARTYPIFAEMRWKSSLFLMPTVGAGEWLALALQNQDAVPVTVNVEALNAAGATMGSTTVVVGPNTRVARTVKELVPGNAGSILRVTSLSPVQVLGLHGRDTAGVVDPVLPVQVQ